MKPLDDMLPEEQETHHQELITSLQQACHRSVPVIPTEEQAQIITRVRERLMETDHATSGSQNIPVQEIELVDTSPHKPKSSAKTTRRGSILRLINVVAAVLVVGAIIGTSLLLFRHRPQADGGVSTGPTDRTVTVSAHAGGLDMSMHITMNQYFLSELLAADTSLTNHSHTTFLLAGSPGASLCDSALNITMTGGGSPHYTFPVNDFTSCLAGPGMMQLKPGHTITTHQYIPLTSSGRLTLTAEATFLATKVGPHGEKMINVGSSPLDGHWPSIQIQVASHIPSDRTLSLQQQGSQVSIDAPTAARSHLVYLFFITCDQGQGSTEETGSLLWEPIATNVLHKPNCSGTHVHWSYAVGAPGYAIASGSSTS